MRAQIAIGNGPGKPATLKKNDADMKDSIAALQARVDKEQGVKTIKTVHVTATDLVVQPFSHSVQVQAAVYGQENINVNAEMPGVVKSILVVEGDKVSKGQVLATLDDAVLRQNIEELKTSLSLSDTLYVKQKSLWDQKVGTEVQYLSAKNNYESLQQRLLALQQQDEMTKIISPIDGIVDAVSIKIGESVAPGLPTIQVVNAEQLKVKGNVDEGYLSDIHKGDSLAITFPDLQKTIKSVATYVSSAIDPVNRTFMVEVGLPQSTDYHPNMIATMNIVDYTNRSAIVVPINIVQNDPTGQFLFIAVPDGKGWKAVKQMVTLGKVYNGNAEITKGLNPGDKIITTGYDDLNNGDALSL